MSIVDDENMSDPRKELTLSAILLTNRRIVQQKQKQVEHEKQKQMKNASRQQLEIKLHQHQFPHPTPEQIQAEQHHLQVMYGQNSVSLYSPHFLGNAASGGASGGAGSGGGGGGGGGGDSSIDGVAEPKEYHSGYIQGLLYSYAFISFLIPLESFRRLILVMQRYRFFEYR